MRRIISNTGPVLHLREAGLLALLEPAGRITIPPRVDAELLRHDPTWRIERPSWIAIEPLTESAQRQARAWYLAGLLDAGEAEALALAHQERADWFLTDDTAARLLASSQGLEVHGSLGIVLWTAATQGVDRQRAGAALDALAGSSLWFSPRVLAEAREALARLPS